MKNETTTNIAERFSEFVNYMAAHIAGREIVHGVSPKTHQKTLKSLKESIPYQRAFYVTNLHDQSISYCSGVKEWLGYDDATCTIPFFPTLIHPNHVEEALFMSSTMFELVKTKKLANSFMDKKYAADLAHKHANGHYVLVRTVVSSWDFDAISGLPIAFITEFIILEDYNEAYSPGIRPRATDFYNNRVPDFEDFVRDFSYDRLENGKIFTVQELRILRKYAYNVDFESKDIASAFKISIKTVETHNKRIIAKYNESFLNYPLKSVKEIAGFLRREYFV
jgi:hypothetical protein